MTRRRVLAALALAAVAPGRRAMAQALEPLDLDAERWFRLSWEVIERRGRPRLLGRIDNVGDFGAGRIRILVDQLGADGRPTSQKIEWVGIDVRPGDHTYFDVPVADRAATYRVRVYTFNRKYGGGG